MKSKIKRSGRGDFPFLQQLFLLWAEGLWPMVITYRFLRNDAGTSLCIDCDFLHKIASTRSISRIKQQEEQYKASVF